MLTIINKNVRNSNPKGTDCHFVRNGLIIYTIGLTIDYYIGSGLW